MNRSKQPVWRLKRNLAEVRWRDLALQVDVHQPATGVTLHLPGSKPNLQLLGTPQVLFQPQEKLDPYTRAGHLITAYPCTEQRIFGGELSYRVREFGHPDLDDESKSDEEFDASNEQATIESTARETLTIELVYSIQTDLLDTQPRPVVVSRLQGNSMETFSSAGGELRPSKTECEIVACLIRNGDQLMLVSVMPSDHAGCSILRNAIGSGETKFEVCWELAADFLEKGVIRRFRAWGAVGSDRASLLAAAHAFYHSEIPLTA